MGKANEDRFDPSMGGYSIATNRHAGGPISPAMHTGPAAGYVAKIDEAANIVEDVSINLRDLLARMRALSMVKQDAYDAVYLLRRDLGRAVAILDGGYPTPRTSIFHDEGGDHANAGREAEGR